MQTTKGGGAEKLSRREDAEGEPLRKGPLRTALVTARAKARSQWLRVLGARLNILEEVPARGTSEGSGCCEVTSGWTQSEKNDSPMVAIAKRWVCRDT